MSHFLFPVEIPSTNQLLLKQAAWWIAFIAQAVVTSKPSLFTSRFYEQATGVSNRS
jgi:hypothetical protein